MIAGKLNLVEGMVLTIIEMLKKNLSIFTLLHLVIPTKAENSITNIILSMYFTTHTNLSQKIIIYTPSKTAMDGQEVCLCCQLVATSIMVQASKANDSLQMI